MVVKHHQNRHKIHRRCTFIYSSHNCKYFLKPTFVYVHIGQDGIIVLNFILSLTLYGSESPLKVKFYIQSLCCCRTFFLKSSVKYADRNNDSSESIFSLLDTVCSDGIYFEVTFSPGNILIST